jgi:hypothetical protein
MFAALTLQRFATLRRIKSGLIALAATNFIAFALLFVGGCVAALQAPQRFAKT